VNSTFDTVVFDLDGTLVDSAPSILESLQVAFVTVGVNPIAPLHSSIIGPPLPLILQALVGNQTPQIMRNLVAEFKRHYDTLGYRRTIPYSGVEQMLSDLKRLSCSLYIATNKRAIPTRCIVDHFGWAHYFVGIYSLDELDSESASKSDLISHIIEAQRLRREKTVYVGDREEDAIAAQTAGVTFMHAAWGYGFSHPNWKILKTPSVF
jgi:phosphoglycolate phosphatase